MLRAKFLNSLPHLLFSGFNLVRYRNVQVGGDGSCKTVKARKQRCAIDVYPTQFFKEVEPLLSLDNYPAYNLPFNYRRVNQHSEKARREVHVMTKTA